MRRGTRKPKRRWAAFVAALSILTGYTALLAVPASAVETVVESLEVSAGDYDGETTRASLEPGLAYRVEVTGSYMYGIGAYLADAECSRTPSDANWVVNRWGDSMTPLVEKDDPLDLLVDEQSVDWVPAKGSEMPAGSGCSSNAHAYQTAITGVGTPVNFRVYDFGFQDNVGVLSVKIFKTLGEIQVGAAQITMPSGPMIWTVQAYPGGGDLQFQSGVTYRFEVSGTFTYAPGSPDYLADAECSRTPQDATWNPNRFGLTQPWRPLDDPLDLYVDGKAQTWVPRSGDGAACNASDHDYELMFTPDQAKTVGLHIDDSLGDNTGFLDVRVFLVATGGGGLVPQVQAVDDLVEEINENFGPYVPPVPAPPNPMPLVEPAIPLKETLVATAAVDSTTGGGNAQATAGGDYLFKAGRTYRIEATGLYGYAVTGGPDFLADAECSRTPQDPRYTADRYKLQQFYAPLDDPLDVYVDGKQQDWTSTANGSATCNEADHTYQVYLTPATTKAVAFRVHDATFDNSGVLQVKVFSVDETLADTVLVDSRNGNGATSQKQLKTGVNYRYVASQTYMYYAPGRWQADVECSQVANETTWKPDRFAGPDQGGTESWLDLLVDGAPVTWAPLHDNGFGCNQVDHVYSLAPPAPASDAAVNFRLYDPRGYEDNLGVVLVQVFEDLGPA